MYGLVVMTGGISLFHPNNIFGRLTREKGFFEFPGTNPLPKTPADQDGEMRGWLQEMKRHLSHTRGREKNISAEYSLMHALRLNKRLANRPQLVLLHTDTFAARAAAYLNKEILAEDFNASVRLDEIRDLDVTDRLKLNRALGNFMLLLNRHLQDAHRRYVCFTPIGGYKILASLGYIVASFNDLPIAYLHEDKQLLHEIPSLPLKYDGGFIEDNGEFLRKVYVEDVVKKGTLTYNESHFVNDYKYLFEEVDGMLALSPFGRFLCGRDGFRHIFGTQIFLSPQGMEVIKQIPSAEPLIYQQISELVKKIEAGVENDDVFHERQFKSLRNLELQYHLYKGASQGAHAFRAAWRHDKTRRQLFVNHIWLNHDNYEREAAQGRGMVKSTANFDNISKRVYLA